MFFICVYCDFNVYLMVIVSGRSIILFDLIFCDTSSIILYSRSLFDYIAIFKYNIVLHRDRSEYVVYKIHIICYICTIIAKKSAKRLYTSSPTFLDMKKHPELESLSHICNDYSSNRRYIPLH